jgi:hypothetical protein
MTGTPGTPNTGGGGGGGSSGAGGAGGSGIVVIRYLTSEARNLTITGGIRQEGPPGAPLYTVHTFTSSGNFVVTGTASPTDSVSAYGVATGGTVIANPALINGQNYRILQFTESGTLTVTKAGLFDVLMVGSGGAGAGMTNGFGGGGGAGGVDISTVYLSTNQTVTVGGGTAYGARIGTSSRLGTKPDSIVVAGGGSGGGQHIASDRHLAFGGASGGGGMGTGNSIFILGATGIDGGDGGNGQAADSQAGGGGGGNTANGTNGSGTVGGNGGAGYDASTFRGEVAGTTRYGGGGGGGGTSGGTGGVGGGGNRGSAGSVNTGGGGGGATSAGGTGFAGGSGIVLVRFKVA